jgi:RHS repeat-associated protein
MGFYAKDDPACPVAERPETATLSRARKPRSQNAIPPILTVGIGHRFYNLSLGRWESRDPIGEWDSRSVYCVLGSNAIALIDLLGLVTTMEGELQGVKFADTPAIPELAISDVDRNRQVVYSMTISFRYAVTVSYRDCDGCLQEVRTTGSKSLQLKDQPPGTPIMVVPQIDTMVPLPAPTMGAKTALEWALDRIMKAIGGKVIGKGADHSSLVLAIAGDPDMMSRIKGGIPSNARDLTLDIRFVPCTSGRSPSSGGGGKQ